MLRSASFLVQRFVLGRQTLLARAQGFDLELRVPARDSAGARIYCDGMHAPEVADFLVTGLDLRAGDLVFDIGASVGWYSLLLAEVAPRGTRIHAFEPDPWACGMLQENVSRNRADAVTVVAAALGERSGPARLHLHGARRRRRGGLAWLGGPEGVDIEMLRLDDYCRERKLRRRTVGLLKIGVQGFEFFALRGARETLACCRAVLTEFAPRQQELAGVHPVAMLDLLVEHGFSPAVIEAGGLCEVSRAELLAERPCCNLLWRRRTTPAAAAPPDPDALAI